MLEMHMTNLFCNISQGRKYLGMLLFYAEDNYAWSAVSCHFSKSTNHAMFGKQIRKYATQYSPIL